MTRVPVQLDWLFVEADDSRTLVGSFGVVLVMVARGVSSIGVGTCAGVGVGVMVKSGGVVVCAATG